MKKILLIVLALLLAVVVFMPKYVGMQFASGLQSSAEEITTKSAYTVSVDEIDSGWGSTTAFLSVGLKLPELSGNPADPLDLSTKIKLEASHGPILSGGSSLFGQIHILATSVESELPAGLQLAEENAPILTFNSTTGLFGGTDFTAEILGLSYKDLESDVRVDFSGMQVNGNGSSNSYAFSAASDSVTASSGELVLAAVNAIEMSGTGDVGVMQMVQQGLYDSESNISFANIALTNMFDGSQTNVNNASMLIATTLDTSTDMGSFIINTKVDSFDAPDIQMSDLVLDMDMNNIQAKFMRAYQAFSVDSMDYVSDPAAMESAMNSFLEDHLLEQLQQNPEYNISNFSGVVNGGAFNGKILTKLTNVSTMPSTLEDPAFWMQHGNVDSQMTMQKAAADFFAMQFIATQVAGNPQFLSMSETEQQQMLMQQAQATLDAFVEQGMLTTEGENYSVSFTMQNANAELNGNPIPL